MKTLVEILTEVLNEGIEGSLKPNAYALGKIAKAKADILELVEKEKDILHCSGCAIFETTAKCTCKGAIKNIAIDEIRKRMGK